MKTISLGLFFAIASSWIYVVVTSPYGPRLTALVVGAFLLSALVASGLSLITNRFFSKPSLRITLSSLVFLGVFPFVCTAMIRVISRYEWSIVEPGVDTIYYGTSGMQHGDLGHTVFASLLPAIAFLVFQFVRLIRHNNQPNKPSLTRDESINRI